MSADESNSWFSNIAEPPGLEDSTDGSTMLSILAGLIATEVIDSTQMCSWLAGILMPSSPLLREHQVLYSLGRGRVVSIV